LCGASNRVHFRHATGAQLVILRNRVSQPGTWFQANLFETGFFLENPVSSFHPQIGHNWMA
jgi:hypothetical protein